MLRVMVKRGPQLVQLVKGYRKRRSFLSVSSARQSAQVLMSGLMSTSCPAPPLLLRISKASASGMGGMSWLTTRMMRDSGGCSGSSLRRNSSRWRRLPWISMSTPSGALRTMPARPRSRASL